MRRISIFTSGCWVGSFNELRLWSAAIDATATLIEDDFN